MDEQKAREVLEEAIQPDNKLSATFDYIEWPLNGDASEISLDGNFNLEQLKAIVWWIENMELK